MSLAGCALALVAVWHARAWRRDRARALAWRAERGARHVASDDRRASTGLLDGRGAPARGHARGSAHGRDVGGVRVSVLVAAWDEAGCVERHVRSFLRLPRDTFELVLCAGGEDDTYERAVAYSGPTVTVLRQEAGEDKQRALRRCLERATGNLIYLADADTIFDQQTVRAVLRPLLSGEAEAATGSVRPLPGREEDPFVGYQYAVQAYGALMTGHFSAGLHGANCAVTRRALLDAGGFDGDAPTGTDYYLAQRLARRGVRVRMVREAAPSDFPASARAYRRQQSRWLRNLFLHGVAFGNRRDVVHVVITDLVGMLGLGLPVAAVVAGAQGARRRHAGDTALANARRGRLLPGDTAPLVRDGIWLAWALLFAHGLASRLRCIAAARSAGLVVPWSAAAVAMPMILVDWASWALALLELAHPSRRWRW